MRLVLLAVALALPLVALGISFGDNCSSAKTCGECTSRKKGVSFMKFTCRWCELDKTCRAPGEQMLGRGACNKNTFDTEPAGCPADSPPWKPYDEGLAKKLTRFAARAYSNPQNCEALDGARMDVTVTAKHKNGGESLGFVAVDDKQKAIILSFRGTNSPTQLASEGIHVLGDWSDFGDGEVQRYFKRSVDRLWPCMLPRVNELAAKNPNYNIWVTGHSLGGAMAAIAAFELALNQGISGDRIRLVTLGQPRTGDKPWARHLDRLLPYNYRVVFENDVVTQIPFCGAGKQTTEAGKFSLARFVAPCWGTGMFEFPFHHGLEIWYKGGKSGQFMKCDQGIQGEDDRCSASASRISLRVSDHSGYAKMWGTATCKPAAFDMKLEYTDQCHAYRH